MLIGWCGGCGFQEGKQGRYICTRCALRESVDDIEAGWQRLVCRYCGTRLGKVEEVIRLSELEFSAFDPQETDQRSPNEITPIPGSAWWSLYQHGISSGLIITSGMQQALRANDRGDSSRALVLLNEELNRCKSVDFQAGIGRCLLEIGKLSIEAVKPDEALGVINEAEPLLRQSRNDKLLRECLGYKMWLQKATHASADERLTVLNEVLKLYFEAQARGMIRYDQAIELFLKERIGLLLEGSNLIDAIADLRKLPDGVSILRKMAEQVHEDNEQKNRLPRHAADVAWDEDLLDKMRSTQDVWGCPEGCETPGTYGMVGAPRQTDGSGVLCPLCGARYILLNGYYSLTAGVPDFMNAKLVEPDSLHQVPADTVEVFNHSLVVREGGDPETADRLQQLVVSEWEDLLGSHSPEFALSLSMVGGSLLFRDEHSKALSLFERVVDICEQSLERQSELLASCLNNIGISLASLRNLPRAEEVLRRACELNPALPNPYYWLARLYAGRHRSDNTELEEAAWKFYVDRTPSSLLRGEEAFLRLIEFASSKRDSKRVTDLQQQLREFRQKFLK
jgi:tetratricopeptide (TPR) repeat protein/DNA-directed RNA polymerase subunit RPC12/RpoP